MSVSCSLRRYKRSADYYDSGRSKLKGFEWKWTVLKMQMTRHLSLFYLKNVLWFVTWLNMMQYQNKKMQVANAHYE